MTDTPTKLLQAAAEVLCDPGLAGASARVIADRAGINQALVFYHFGTVSELLGQACRTRVDQAIPAYAEEFSAVTSLSDLLALGRRLHERERAGGNVAIMAQMLAGAQQDPVLADAAAYALARWTAEIERVVARVMASSPIEAIVDVPGLARAIGASFIGLELYDVVDADGAAQALASLESLGALVNLIDGLGPAGRRVLRAKLKTLRPARH